MKKMYLYRFFFYFTLQEPLHHRHLQNTGPTNYNHTFKLTRYSLYSHTRPCEFKSFHGVAKICWGSRNLTLIISLGWLRCESTGRKQKQVVS